MVHFAYHDHNDLKPVCFAPSVDSESKLDELGKWMFCLSRITLVTYLNITVTNTVHNFVFILYSMKSPESNYICFSWKFKKVSVIRCHCRQPHIAANFPSLYRLYHGSKSSLHYFMFCIFFHLFCCCCCCCHFRCFYCKKSPHGVNLVSLIHVCWKCALIRLLIIKKKPCIFPEICLWIHVRPRESHNKWDTLFFFSTDGSTFGFSSVHRFAAAYELGFYFIQRPI